MADGHHLSIDDVLGIRHGEGGGRAAAAASDHLAACSRCAAMAQAMFADDAPHTLGAALDRVDVDVDVAPPARRWPYLAAAAIVVALVGAGILLRDAPAPPPPARPRPPVAAAARPAYERPEWASLVRDAAASGRIAVAPAVPRVAEHDVLRGEGEPSGATMTPAGVAVESQQPELRWPEVRGAHYAVTILADGKIVADSGRLDRNRWTPQHPLGRGRVYEWQVRISGRGRISSMPSPPQPNPRFAVVSEQGEAELAAARAAHPDDPLLLAVLAARYGLRGEAAQQLARYRAAHPAARISLEGQ